MCELFGLSASRPLAASETFLANFPTRGGLTADNPDGWGIAWRENGRFRLSKEPLPGYSSALFASLSETLVSDLVVAHVRKAKFPPVVSLNNTHPFQRACCGREWVFAHNGLVPDIVPLEQANTGRICQPEGETDSEFAFCHLLSHVARHQDATGWLEVLGKVSELIAHYGKFNFLLSDGDYLIAYGHDRLHYLEEVDSPIHVALIATEPLSVHAGWTPFTAGELRIYRSGSLVVEQVSKQP